MGPDHPELWWHLASLSYVYEAQGRENEFELLYKRALAALQKLEILGDDPDIFRARNEEGLLLQNLGFTNIAEPLNKRAMAIWEKTPNSKRDQCPFP